MPLLGFEFKEYGRRMWGESEPSPSTTAARSTVNMEGSCGAFKFFIGSDANFWSSACLQAKTAHRVLGQREKPPPEGGFAGKSRCTIIFLIVLVSTFNLGTPYYCAITANPLNQPCFALLNQEIRRGPDPHPVNFPPQRSVKIGPVQRQQDCGLGSEGGDDHRAVLGFGENQGSFSHGQGIRDELEDRLDFGFPRGCRIWADFGEVAEGFLEAVARGEQGPTLPCPVPAHEMGGPGG